MSAAAIQDNQLNLLSLQEMGNIEDGETIILREKEGTELVREGMQGLNTLLCLGIISIV